MAVQVIPQRLMVSDVTTHQARYVGEGIWELSCLPGRQLTTEQAADALRAAEESTALLAWMRPRALDLGLTERELFGFVTTGECHWPRPSNPDTPTAWSRLGRRWSLSGGAA